MTDMMGSDPAAEGRDCTVRALVFRRGGKDFVMVAHCAETRVAFTYPFGRDEDCLLVICPHCAPRNVFGTSGTPTLN